MDTDLKIEWSFYNQYCSLRCTAMCFVIIDEIFPIKSLKSQSIIKLDVLVLKISTSIVVFCLRKRNYFSLERI